MRGGYVESLGTVLELICITVVEIHGCPAYEVKYSQQNRRQWIGLFYLTLSDR